MAEAIKKEEVKPKGPIGKLKEAVDDKDCLLYTSPSPRDCQ